MDERAFCAAQDFVLEAKRFWTTDLFSRVRQEFVNATDAKADDEATNAAAIADMLRSNTTYQYFAWLERHLQRLKYSGRYGLAPHYEERRDKILERRKARLQSTESTLDRSVATPLPDYYTSFDTHQHPGGLWGSEVAGDVYECGARSTTPLLGDQHEDLHWRFSRLVGELGQFRSILDVGCGFGKSTLPFASLFPQACVRAVDLSEPCLGYAAEKAIEKGADNVVYAHQDAAQLQFADEQFDLVTSTMLLHEMPPEHIRRYFAEAIRVLSPGGWMVNLDFYVLDDEFQRFLHYGHSVRNNEPFMRSLAEMDLPADLKAAGFQDVRIARFEESAGAMANRGEWRFPWTTIAARKPAA